MSTHRLINTPRRLLLRQAAAGAALVMAAPLTRAALGNRSTVDVTEGPYFVDELLNRADIRVDPSDGTTQEGLLLLLSVSVSTLDTATGVTKPLPGAYVDLWHCNSQGLYSDESANNTVGKKFLRGYQVSDRQGKVQFRSIYPGWYSGRSPHIHCKVRQYANGVKSSELTTQFFFDEQLTQLVYSDSTLPYYPHGLPDQPHVTDQVYTGNNSCITGAVAGDSLMLTLVRTAKYVTAKFDILIDASNRCASSETNSGGGGAGGGGTPPGGGGTPPSLPPGATTPSTT
jgi:protocatechuate 3,4-dioxygenase beta subunit